MSKTRVPKNIRLKVAAAAHHRCAYCQTAERIIGPLLEVDHIVPESLGGTGEDHNLTLACPLCNSHKSNLTEALDPISGALVPLFDPHSHHWEEHFEWEEAGTVVHGKTPIGRATVAALQMNHKEELIRIIVKIVDTYPEAESIVLMPLPGSSATTSPLDADIIRRQVRHVTDHFPREWGASYAAAAKVAALISPGDEYAAAGDWQNAAVVYATIADVILEDYPNLYEEEGEFVAIVAECADGLVDCLGHAADPILRRALLERLFRIWQWDITMGGVGAGDSSQAAMIEETTETEKALVAEWVRRTLPESDTDSYSSGWKRGAIGGFLLELEGERLDDESYLRICRETGRLNDLVRRLLQLKRIEEATEAARQAGDYALLGLADVFQAAGHDQVVAGLIRERLPQSRDTRLFEWLISYDMAGQRYEAALGLSRQLFTLRTDVQTYVRVSEAAQRLGNWDTVRTALLDELRQAKHYEVCVQIFLHEGQIDSALEALATLRRAYPYASDHMVLAVAHAAEAERPQAAIDLYVQAATRLIDRRGRPSYAEAAQVLARARALLLQTNQAARWTALIAQIRQENRRLPALQDELNRAKL